MKILRCNLSSQPLTATVLAGNREIDLKSDTLRHLAVATAKTDNLQRVDDAEVDLVQTQEIQDIEAAGDYEYRGADAVVPERLQKFRASLGVVQTIVAAKPVVSIHDPRFPLMPHLANHP